jgi:hypothetical protein
MLDVSYDGRFEQNGGTVRAARLVVNGHYHFRGGVLEPGSVWQIGYAASMTFPAAPTVVEFDGLFDLDPAAAVVNGANVTLNLGPHSLLVRRGGVDPAQRFAMLTNAGLEHVAGTTLMIPAGRSVKFDAEFSDPIDCRGSLDVRNLESPGVVRDGATIRAYGLNQPRGTFLIEGGTVTVHTLDASDSPVHGAPQVLVHQAGGTVTAEYLIVGARRGRYVLEGGRLDTGVATVGARTSLGFATNGEFVQTGGEHVVRSELVIGNGSHSRGHYQISGGRLTVATLSINTLPSFGPPFPPPPGDGHFQMSNPGAEVVVTTALRLGQDAPLSAVAGSKIRMRGASFENVSTNPEELFGLQNLLLNFTGGDAQTPLTFEVAGTELGLDDLGFFGNFTLGTLQVGAGADEPAWLLLQDLHDNRVSFTEALYVENLILDEGSTLDLNGLRVYVRNFTDLGGTILPNGGRLVPEPGGLRCSQESCACWRPGGGNGFQLRFGRGIFRSPICPTLATIWFR